jgi:hypothetical protein
VPTDTPAKACQTISVDVDADGNLTGPVPDSRENTVLAVTAACGVWALTASSRQPHIGCSTESVAVLGTGWKQFDIPPR